MKIVWVCVLLVFSSPAFCQETHNKLPEALLKKLLEDTTVNPFSYSKYHSMQRGWTRIDSTSMGTVYALPLDNMPCIVPGENPSQRMPNFGKNLGYIDPGIYMQRFRNSIPESNKVPYKLKRIPKKKSAPLK